MMNRQRNILVFMALLVITVNLGAVPSAVLPEQVIDPIFGYKWELLTSLPDERWQDISTTGESLFAGEDVSNINDGYVSIPVPFASNKFRLFDDDYANFNVNINGLIILDDRFKDNFASSNGPIPYDAPPNGLIAGFWADLWLSDSLEQAAVYYQHFSAPDLPLACAGSEECVVFQWHQAIEYGTNKRNTFQIVLLDNFDIHVLYHTMGSSSEIAAVGLEAHDGIYGVETVYREAGIVSGNELIFEYPDPSTRHKARPVYQSGFLSRDGAQLERTFTVTVTNNGDVLNPTPEVYEVVVNKDSLTTGWDVIPLFLVDTEESVVGLDTGPLLQGTSANIQFKVIAPLDSDVGEFADVTVEFWSQSGDRIVEARLYAAFAAPFAQIVHNDDLFLRTMWEQHQVNRLVKLDFTGRQMSLTHMNGLNFFATWEKRGEITEWDEAAEKDFTYIYSDIEYAFITATGSGYPNVMSNTQHYNTETHPLDNSPAVTVGPDGRAAYAFIREDYYKIGTQLYKKYNVRLMILNADGTPAYPVINPDNPNDPGELKQNLTKNNKIYYFSEPTAPKYQNPRLTTTSDGNYVVSWTTTIGTSNTVDMAIVGPDGAIIVPPLTKFASEDPDDDGDMDIRYYDPGMTRFNGTNILLAGQRYNALDSTFQIVYKIFNGLDGSDVTDEVGVPNGNGGAPDVIQLAGGKGLLAWKDSQAGISYVMVNSNGDLFSSVPVQLVMPDTRPMASVSVTRDVHGNGILTWLDIYDDRLYYALVDESGGVKTLPMIIVQGDGTSPVRSSQLGYGNAFFEGKAFNYLPLLLR